MKQNKNCTQLDVAKKIKIKVDDMGTILYVNNYFTEVTKFKVSELILKDFNTILDPSMPKMLKDYLKDISVDTDTFYFIYKGSVKNGGCYWSFVKVEPYFNEQNELSGFLLEGKMLPLVAVEKIEKLFSILKEIENNAGMEAAKKYFEGFLEEKDLSFNDFILALTEVNEKKALKYFEIDEDAVAQKKKKRSWF